MKRKEPIVVQVDDVRVDGYGYTADGRYAVTGALPGEEIVGLPFSRQRKKLYLRPQEIRHHSPDRVEPACGAAAFCGGCSFQHASHDYQLTLKETFLRSCLSPLTPVEWLPAITGTDHQYRPKDRLGVKFVEKKGKVLVGLDSADTDFDTVEELRGSKTQTLVTDNLPEHRHGLNLRMAGRQGTNPAILDNSVNTTVSAGDESITFADTNNGVMAYQSTTGTQTTQVGSGTAFDILQPSIVVKFWKRTA